LKSHHSREGSTAAIIVVVVLALGVLIALCVGASKQRPQPAAPTYRQAAPQQRRATGRGISKPDSMSGLGGKTMGEWMDGKGDSKQLKARKKRMHKR
jgi:hypothetical protein